MILPCFLLSLHLSLEFVRSRGRLEGGFVDGSAASWAPLAGRPLGTGALHELEVMTLTFSSKSKYQSVKSRCDETSRQNSNLILVCCFAWPIFLVSMSYESLKDLLGTHHKQLSLVRPIINSPETSERELDEEPSLSGPVKEKEVS